MEEVDGKAQWFRDQLSSLRKTQFTYIDSLEEVDFELLADQVFLVAYRISRVQRLLIGAATPGAIEWLPTARILFATMTGIPIETIEGGGPDRLKNSDHVILLHGPNLGESESGSGGELRLVPPNLDLAGNMCVHIVLGTDAPARSDRHRLIRIDDGTSSGGGVIAALNICCVIAQAVGARLDRG